MSVYKKEFGRFGEEVAKKYLEKSGYEILERNFRIWGGEVDIIAKDPVTKEIVFFEIKTRVSEYWQHLDETLRSKQISFIKSAGKRFLFYRKMENCDWRIDHIGILLNFKTKKVKKLEHFKAV